MSITKSRIDSASSQHSDSDSAQARSARASADRPVLTGVRLELLLRLRVPELEVLHLVEEVLVEQAHLRTDVIRRQVRSCLQ